MFFRGPDSERISIHAPREGSDAWGDAYACLRGEFQSTLPVRGATGGIFAPASNRAISIHAPREGSDIPR